MFPAVARACLAMFVLVLATLSFPTRAAAVAPAACGTPLSAAEIATIAELSDTSTVTGNGTLARLEDQVERHRRITEILVRHQDRRGLFPLGLDAVEQIAVMPMQRDPGAFADREYAHRISFELLRRWLVNLHAEFTGAPTEPHWARYFEVTARCGLSGGRVAAAGYNAHITVDLAYAAAAVGSGPEHIGDFLKIVDAIAQHGQAIVDLTLARYDVDLGPPFRLYFLGEGLDLLAGKGVASGALLRLADTSFNAVTFGNGLALQNPALAPAAAAEIDGFWRANDVAFEVLAGIGGL